MKNVNADVLFINLPHNRLSGQEGVLGIPYGMLQIATVLKNNGINVKVYDSDIQSKTAVGKKCSEDNLYNQSLYEKNIKDDNNPIWKEVERVIRLVGPRIVGIGITTSQYPIALKTAMIVKGIDKKIIVVVGGPHPTALPEKTAEEPNFDIAVRGEGEQTMFELVDSIKNLKEISHIKGITYKKNGRIISTQNRPMLRDINKIPFPDRDLLIDIKKYPKSILGQIITSRGCPHRCIFCSPSVMWGNKVRLRSPENVIDEIEYVHKKYGTREFQFVDDTFNIDTQRVTRICDLIKERGLTILWSCNVRADNISEDLVKKMKSSGCYIIRMGIESGDQKILNSIKKNLSLSQVKNSIGIIKKNNIELFAWFMIGNLEETEDTIKNTRLFIDETRLDMMGITFAVPFPGTELYEIGTRKNKIMTSDWCKYTGCVPILKIDNMTIDNLYRYYNEFLEHSRKLYKISSKRRIRNINYVYKKILANIKSPHKIMKFIKEGIMINMGY